MVAKIEIKSKSSKPARPSIDENIIQLDILHLRESIKHLPTVYF